QMSRQPRSAFAYATIALRLATKFPNFIDILIHQFNLICPYTIPLYPEKRREGESMKDYKLRLGYKEDLDQEDGVETREQFYSHMGGLMSLFSAIIQTPETLIGARHPFGIEEGWSWLASIL